MAVFNLRRVAIAEGKPVEPTLELEVELIPTDASAEMEAAVRFLLCVLLDSPMSGRRSSEVSVICTIFTLILSALNLSQIRNARTTQLALHKSTSSSRHTYSKTCARLEALQNELKFMDEEDNIQTQLVKGNSKLADMQAS